MNIYNFLTYLIVTEIREGVGIRRGSVIGDFPLLCLAKGQPGFCPAPIIGYSQLTSISGGRPHVRNLGSRLMRVFITTSPYQFSDIDE